MGEFDLKKAVPKNKQKEFTVFTTAGFSAFEKEGLAPLSG